MPLTTRPLLLETMGLEPILLMSKTNALPFGYVPIRTMGFEPIDPAWKADALAVKRCPLTEFSEIRTHNQWIKSPVLYR
jgi:hypothetical protein